MKVDLSRRAEREMERIARWWQEHASLPNIFLDELEEMIEHIETTSVLGAVYDAMNPRHFSFSGLSEQGGGVGPDGVGAPAGFVILGSRRPSAPSRRGTIRVHRQQRSWHTLHPDFEKPRLGEIKNER
jgi:hypothetical protein